MNIFKKLLLGVVVISCCSFGTTRAGAGEDPLWFRALRGMGEALKEGAEWAGDKIEKAWNHVKELKKKRERLREEIAQFKNQNPLFENSHTYQNMMQNLTDLDKEINAAEEAARRKEATMEKVGDRAVDMAFDQIKAQSDLKAAKALAQIDAEASIEKWKVSMQNFFEPNNMKNMGILGGSLLLVASAAYFGGKYGYEYALQQLKTPEIVSKTNIRSGFQRIFGGEIKERSRLKEFVAPPGIQEEITRIAKTIKTKITKGRLLTNGLFYGPPGTGKTMFAVELAKLAGAYYDVIAGANFSQFKEGEDVQALNRYFMSRLSLNKPVICFIDEADAFLLSRDLPQATARSNRLLDTFLSWVNSPSSKNLMFVFATNHPERLDRAVHDRIGPKVEFKLPALAQREQLIANYLNKHVKEFGITLESEKVESQIVELAPLMQGFSARTIEQTMVDMQTIVDEHGVDSLSIELAKKVIDKKIAEQKFLAAIEKQKQEQFGTHGFVGEAGGIEMVSTTALAAAGA